MSDQNGTQGFSFDPNAIEDDSNQSSQLGASSPPRRIYNNQQIVETQNFSSQEISVGEVQQNENAFVGVNQYSVSEVQNGNDMNSFIQQETQETQQEYVEQETQNQDFYENSTNNMQQGFVESTQSETDYLNQQTVEQEYEEVQDFNTLNSQLETQNSLDPMNRQIVPFQQGVDIIRLVDDMFQSSIAQGASDMHIEPFEQFLAIRFRVDGDFIEYLNFAPEYAESILTRIEVLAGLKLDKNRLPQDGKISYKSTSGQRVDMRVSTFPTMYGNKVCIRLLVKEDSVKTLASLGYAKEALATITKNLQRTFGMVLMTGPTGSGKSTTLFGMLSTYNPFEYNISTLEDPIEYFIPGVNQSQVNTEIGYDFPDGLRTLVRQDPDIIMVGEIRDKVTASLAVNAAITGHLVFSTLHANTASATIQRLMNMDVDHFLVASALNLIVSQRLVRRICSHCKQEFVPDAHTLEKVKVEMAHVPGVNTETATFYRGEGCDVCKGSGYKGRVAIYELLEITPEISKVVIEKQGVAEEIEKVAVEQGMVTIKQHGIMAAMRGDTTIEEVLIASDSMN